MLACSSLLALWGLSQNLFLFSYTFFSVFLLFLALIKFAFSSAQLLLMLLCLELFTLMAFFLFIPLLTSQLISVTALFSFLTFAVCEASVGLALLIRTARTSGSSLCQL